MNLSRSYWFGFVLFILGAFLIADCVQNDRTPMIFAAIVFAFGLGIILNSYKHGKKK